MSFSMTLVCVSAFGGHESDVIYSRGRHVTSTPNTYTHTRHIHKYMYTQRKRHSARKMMTGLAVYARLLACISRSAFPAGALRHERITAFATLLHFQQYINNTKRTQEKKKKRKRERPTDWLTDWVKEWISRYMRGKGGDCKMESNCPELNPHSLFFLQNSVPATLHFV